MIPTDPGGSTGVVGYVNAATDDPHVRESMLLGALLEGGNWTGPWSLGDQGTSGGPFQIHWTVHPDVVAAAKRQGVTPAQLTSDPGYAVQYMLPEYKAAVAKVPTELWQTNPEKAAEQAAYLAERPAQDYYVSRGAKTVADAYGKVRTAGAGGSAGTEVAQTGQEDQPGSILPSGAGVVHVHIPIPYSPDLNFDFPWARISLFLLGGVLLYLGFRVTFSGAASIPGPA